MGILSMAMQYGQKGMYNIGKVGETASMMSMLLSLNKMYIKTIILWKFQLNAESWE